MIKLVGFDLDGTIADTIPMCIKAFDKAVRPYTSHELSDEEIVQTFGLNEEGMIRRVVERFGMEGYVCCLSAAWTVSDEVAHKLETHNPDRVFRSVQDLKVFLMGKLHSQCF